MRIGCPAASTNLKARFLYRAFFVLRAQINLVSPKKAPHVVLAWGFLAKTLSLERAYAHKVRTVGVSSAKTVDTVAFDDRHL